MSTLYVFVIIVTFSTNCSAYVLSHSETDRSIASVILKEGQSAEISCMTKGTGDFFWWKGETLYNSTLVASFTLGEVSDDSQPYSVTVNGTLHIRSVTLKDEGNYFCRLSSTENECYGEVKILVQASLFNFDLAIDRCDRQSSCLLYLDPSQSTSMTCIALNAPPLMTLKWFNGSKEITEGIVQNEILSQNGNSREITSTVAAVYGRPASLTCQAVDPKRSNDDVRFAHAQVEMTVPFIETLPSWIIVSVTLAGCFIVFGIFLLIKAMINREQQKKYTKVKKEDDESLKGELKKNRNENIELQTKVAKDEANIKSAEENLMSKAKSIAELEFKLKLNEEELKKKSDENIGLHQTISNALANDKVKTTIAEMDVKTKDKKISGLEEDVKAKDKKISELEEDVKAKDRTISGLETDLKKKDIEKKGKIDDLSKFMIDVKTKDKKISGLEEDVKAKEKTISGLEEDVKAKDRTISGLETDLKKKDIEKKGKIDDLSKFMMDVKTKDKKISGLEEDVKAKEKTISGLEEEVKAKYKTISGLETVMKKKDIEIKGKIDDLSKLRTELKEKDNVTQMLRTDLELKVIEVKVKLDEIQKLNDKLDLKDRELKEARKEKKADDKGRKGR